MIKQIVVGKEGGSKLSGQGHTNSNNYNTEQLTYALKSVRKKGLQDDSVPVSLTDAIKTTMSKRFSILEQQKNCSGENAMGNYLSSLM